MPICRFTRCGAPDNGPWNATFVGARCNRDRGLEFVRRYATFGEFTVLAPRP